ncbi:GliK protein [Aspergillus ellipticus CBS 707.79]|uniref:gamma-glutamylcyclotransferase n=1 Tax=Aspergillus ellipticus CBS 707.79 TaxID=1448320 RepID=A0A319E8E0_9EURO|nr:GliK protein [Aspergillus ellipticus CBS 707.79]
MAIANQEGGLSVPRARWPSMIETFEELSSSSGNGVPSPQNLGHILPKTTHERQQVSATDRSLDNDAHLPEKVVAHHLGEVGDRELPLEKTVLYLAYGSNLCSETFRGRRGIKPLSQINVIVPDLRLTFDLPGVPYIEPCFAATRFHDSTGEKEGSDKVEYNGLNGTTISVHSPLISGGTPGCNSNIPLVGVVYEVTLSDYARIIATEGGGRGYEDKVVDCYPFPESYDAADPIPELPITRPFKAHTLMSPIQVASVGTRKSTFISNFGHLVRPNAQPSARYLNLIETGAAEHDFPMAYRKHLSMVQPYRITSLRQRIGKAVFLGTWGPLMLLVMGLSRSMADIDGRSPGWLLSLGDYLFFGMWQSYDNVFSRIFGEGEKATDHDDTR